MCVHVHTNARSPELTIVAPINCPSLFSATRCAPSPERIIFSFPTCTNGEEGEGEKAGSERERKQEREREGGEEREGEGERRGRKEEGGRKREGGRGKEGMREVGRKVVSLTEIPRPASPAKPCSISGCGFVNVREAICNILE